MIVCGACCCPCQHACQVRTCIRTCDCSALDAHNPNSASLFITSVQQQLAFIVSRAPTPAPVQCSIMLNSAPLLPCARFILSPQSGQPVASSTISILGHMSSTQARMLSTTQPFSILTASCQSAAHYMSTSFSALVLTLWRNDRVLVGKLVHQTVAISPLTPTSCVLHHVQTSCEEAPARQIATSHTKADCNCATNPFVPHTTQVFHAPASDILVSTSLTLFYHICHPFVAG